MTDLLSQLRDATEGSRELDGQIEAFRLGWQHEMWDGAGEVCREDGRIRHIADAAIGHYTTNLQDAVSLFPPGTRIKLELSIHGGFCSAQFPGDDGAYFSHRDDICLAICEVRIKAHASKAEAA